MSTYNWLDLQTPGSQPPVMPKNLPDHCLDFEYRGKTTNVVQDGNETPYFLFLDNLTSNNTALETPV